MRIQAKLVTLLGLALAALAFSVSCQQQTSNTQNASAQQVHKEAEQGTSTPKTISAATEYKSWAKLNDKPILSKGHGGKWVVAFANKAADDAIKSGKTSSFPAGSIFVKEAYKDDGGKPGELSDLTVMEKRAGFDPANNDWYWAMTDPKGNVMTNPEMKMPVEGKVQMCSACHIQAKATDFVFTAEKLKGKK
ncbi:MAG TPA: cytochrome P460 family protein [Blastocatellia bacterium]|nr:cytochrome P460 family protein [Blastocatellia bacterium]